MICEKCLNKMKIKTIENKVLWICEKCLNKKYVNWSFKEKEVLK